MNNIRTKWLNLACVATLGMSTFVPIVSAQTGDLAPLSANGSENVSNSQSTYFREYEVANKQYEQLLQKISAYNAKLDTLGDEVTLGEPVVVTGKTVSDVMKLVDEHVETTDAILSRGQNYPQELAQYERRKAEYNANRDEIIRYNKENGSIEIKSEDGKNLVNIVGNEFRLINIQKIFTEENSEKVNAAKLRPGSTLTLIGEEGVDAEITVQKVQEKNRWILDRLDVHEEYRRRYGFPLNLTEGEFTIKFTDHATGEPVNILTIFDTVDFDEDELLSFKSNTGTSAMLGGVRETISNSDGFEIYKGGYAPTGVVGRAGSTTAIGGSEITIRLENAIAILGIFKDASSRYEVHQSALKPVPAPFSEKAPERADMTVQKLQFSTENAERLKPIKPTTEEIELPFKTNFIANDSLEFEAKVTKVTGEKGIQLNHKFFSMDANGIYQPETSSEIALNPKDEVIEVGNRKVTEETVPYETITKENPDKPEGYKEVIQKGEAGKTIITQIFEVDSSTGELSNPKEEKTNVPAKDEIIEVGTKKATSEAPKKELPPKEEKTNVPAKDEIVEVETKKATSEAPKKELPSTGQVAGYGLTLLGLITLFGVFEWRTQYFRKNLQKVLKHMLK
ncbi:TPA: G5 domain-containing protein [Streptococcus suis]|nr:G5 domain-containing protein [Streptococcus suis]